MNTNRKKELRDSYKNQPVIGGICRIRCSGNGRVCLQATRNIEGLKNRFAFAVATGTSPDPALRAEWEQYGAGSFAFTVLDEIKKSENQTDKEFSDDLNALYEIWLEKSRAGDLG